MRKRPTAHKIKLSGTAGAADTLQGHRTAAGEGGVTMAYDKVLYNGNIITMDSELSQKTWLAVKDGRIAALGSDPERDIMLP